MIIYDHMVPTMAIVIGVVSALVISFAGYWIYVKRDFGMACMLTLRVLFFLLLGWCLLMPGKKTVETLQMKSRFLVLLDKSSSMTMTPVQDATNRWQVAQSVMRMPWVNNMVNKCDLDIYAFAEDVGPKLSL